jgi:hypothetical protein
MEEKTFRKREALEEKIPDIRKTLQMVQYLKSKKVRAPRVAEKKPCVCPWLALAVRASPCERERRGQAG